MSVDVGRLGHSKADSLASKLIGLLLFLRLIVKEVLSDLHPKFFLKFLVGRLISVDLGEFNVLASETHLDRLIEQAKNSIEHDLCLLKHR